MSNTPDPDRFRNRLAFFLVGSFVGCVPLFVFWGMPETSKDIVTYMVGQLSGMALMALGHYFVQKAGQDALDTKRAETTGKMADAITAAAQSTPPSGDAGKAADDVADAAVRKADQIKGDV